MIFTELPAQVLWQFNFSCGIWWLLLLSSHRSYAGTSKIQNLLITWELVHNNCTSVCNSKHRATVHPHFCNKEAVVSPTPPHHVSLYSDHTAPTCWDQHWLLYRLYSRRVASPKVTDYHTEILAQWWIQVADPACHLFSTLTVNIRVHEHSQFSSERRDFLLSKISRPTKCDINQSDHLWPVNDNCSHQSEAVIFVRQTEHRNIYTDHKPFVCFLVFFNKWDVFTYFTHGASMTRNTNKMVIWTICKWMEGGPFKPPHVSEHIYPNPSNSSILE